MKMQGLISRGVSLPTQKFFEYFSGQGRSEHREVTAVGTWEEIFGFPHQLDHLKECVFCKPFLSAICLGYCKICVDMVDITCRKHIAFQCLEQATFQLRSWLKKRFRKLTQYEFWLATRFHCWHDYRLRWRQTRPLSPFSRGGRNYKYSTLEEMEIRFRSLPHLNKCVCKDVFRQASHSYLGWSWVRIICVSWLDSLGMT